MSHYESGRISLRPNISRRPRTAETNRKGFSFARRGMLWPRTQSAPRSNFLRQLIDGMPVRYVAGLVGIVAALSIVLHAEAFAQTPHASFLEPTDSSANVPLSPTIRIRTNFPIDITRLYQRGDTRTDPKQSVMVVASAFYDHLPDSLIGDGLSFGVKYTVEDDTTLSCTVGYLEYETPYVAIINNLWVITGTGDTVQVPSASVAFTTVLPPHRLESASLLFRNYMTVHRYADVPIQSAARQRFCRDNHQGLRVRPVRSLRSAGYSRYGRYKSGRSGNSDTLYIMV